MNNDKIDKHESKQVKSGDISKLRSRTKLGQFLGQFVATVRLESPLRFKRFSGIRSSDGTNRIFWAFEQSDGRSEIAPEVYALLKSHQRLDNGQHSGLIFEKDRHLGPVWSIRDDEFGRTLADRLDIDLLNLGNKLTNDRDNGSRSR